VIEDALYVAVDLGAGSGRVFLAGAGHDELLLEEVRRFLYPPHEIDGHLRWDLIGIFEEIKTGLREAGARAIDLNRPVQSVGVDSWAVDYGLMDDSGRLTELPICYRDGRTQGMMEAVFARVPRAEIFERTGIQFQNFNTLFQLYAHNLAGIPASAARLLLIPDLINQFLSGRSVTEYTNATTTQMLAAGNGQWDLDLLDRLGLPVNLLAPIVPAGTDLGSLRPELAAVSGLERARVVAPATHDTASAVAATPIDDHRAYISSGTWSLVGVELDHPLVDAAVAADNFTNEGGVFGTVRFLKNVMGLWILESCRREWQQSGVATEYESLLEQLGHQEPSDLLIFPDDPRFFNPRSMLATLDEQLREQGQTLPADPPTTTKGILDSLALRYASVISRIEALTGRTIREVMIVGGGSRNQYLNQATANATGLVVSAGLPEATVIGNVMLQVIAQGRFASLGEAREHVARTAASERYEPRGAGGWREATRRFAVLEARYAR